MRLHDNLKSDKMNFVEAWRETVSSAGGDRVRVKKNKKVKAVNVSRI